MLLFGYKFGDAAGDQKRYTSELSDATPMSAIFGIVETFLATYVELRLVKGVASSIATEPIMIPVFEALFVMTFLFFARLPRSFCANVVYQGFCGCVFV